MKTEKQVITDIEDYVANVLDLDDLANLWNYLFADVEGQSSITGDDILEANKKAGV